VLCSRGFMKEDGSSRCKLVGPGLARFQKCACSNAIMTLEIEAREQRA